MTRSIWYSCYWPMLRIPWKDRLRILFGARYVIEYNIAAPEGGYLALDVVAVRMQRPGDPWFPKVEPFTDVGYTEEGWEVTS